MTTPRRILVAVGLALTTLFFTVGVSFATPGAERVEGDDADGTHSFDRYHMGDDNGCNFKYNRDGSLRPHKHVHQKDCPIQYPVTNPPNVPGYSGGQTSIPLPTSLVPVLPALTGFPGLPF